MSPRKSTNTLETPAVSVGPRRKPRADLYTVLLVIALIALLVGILFLYLEMDLYEFKLKGGPSVVRANNHHSDFEVRRSAVTLAAHVERAWPRHAFSIFHS